MDESLHPAVRRILAESLGDEVFRALAVDLSGADLTSLLLAVMSERAQNVGPNDVMRQYQSDRFVAPGQVDPVRLLETEARVLKTTSEEFDPVLLAPLVPFGTHASLGGVSQNRLVTTMRQTEVSADPTTALALEAATRRAALLDGEPRTAEHVRLVGITRVTRAQTFEGPGSFSHFSLLGMVTAGRDKGNLEFETETLVHHAASLARVVQDLTGLVAVLTLSDLSGQHHEALETARSTLETGGIEVRTDPDRVAGIGYYPDLCFKLHIQTGEGDIEVGDGGGVGWTRSLLSNNKERLMTSGVSLERLASVGRDSPTAVVQNRSTHTMEP